MDIVINQISNPGLSLTDEINKKLIEMFKLVETIEEKITYSKFQELLINEEIFSGSYIRSVIPFLSDLGIITDYRIIDPNNFFTPLGISYIKIIESLQLVEETDTIYSNLMEIKSDLIGLMLLFMKNSDSKYIDEYINLLKYVNITGRLCKEEYYICKYCDENHISNVGEILNNYRNGLTTHKIRIIGNGGAINDISSNNAYQYINALLSTNQANYLVKYDRSYITLNQKRKEFYEDLMNK